MVGDPRSFESIFLADKTIARRVTKPPSNAPDKVGKAMFGKPIIDVPAMKTELGWATGAHGIKVGKSFSREIFPVGEDKRRLKWITCAMIKKQHGFGVPDVYSGDGPSGRKIDGQLDDSGYIRIIPMKTPDLRRRYSFLQFLDCRLNRNR